MRLDQSNKNIWLSKEGLNEPPGHPPSKVFSGKPQRKTIQTETNDERLTRQHRERIEYGKSLHLLKEESNRIKERIKDQHDRYRK